MIETENQPGGSLHETFAPGSITQELQYSSVINQNVQQCMRTLASMMIDAFLVRRNKSGGAEKEHIECTEDRRNLRACLV